MARIRLHIHIDDDHSLGPGKVAQDPQQRWMTFLRNHRDVIAEMDFFVVPTIYFKRLYVWFVLDHGRRRVLHVNVTAHPAASWVIQQLAHGRTERRSASLEAFEGSCSIRWSSWARTT